jgi:hypothetical protein
VHVVFTRILGIILGYLIKHVLFTLLNWWQVFCTHTLRRSRTEQDKRGLKKAMLIGYIIIDNLHLVVLDADKVSNSPH